jgi:hypothetical protein
MNDPILSAEQIDNWRGVLAAGVWTPVLASHEALSAALEAAQQDASKYRSEAHILTRERDDAWDAKVAAEARAVAAEQRLTDVQARLDGLKRDAERWLAERDGLREALRKYGDHIKPCEWAFDRYRGGLVDADCRPCTCGLTAALASTPPPTAETPRERQRRWGRAYVGPAALPPSGETNDDDTLA